MNGRGLAVLMSVCALGACAQVAGLTGDYQGESGAGGSFSNGAAGSLAGGALAGTAGAGLSSGGTLGSGGTVSDGGGGGDALGGSSALAGSSNQAGATSGDGMSGAPSGGSPNGGTTNGGTTNGGTANGGKGGTANGGTAGSGASGGKGGTANGGTAGTGASGGTANGGTANGGTANGGTAGTGASGGKGGAGGGSPVCTGDPCTCSASGGTNLLQNGGFKTNVASWTPLDANIVLTYSTLDAAGCSSSGSVLASNQAPNGLNSGFYQCVPITAGTSYNAGGWIRTPSGGAQGQTFFQVNWFTGPGCTGSLTSAALIAATGDFDTWELVSKDNLVAPAGTQSGYLYGQIIKNFPNTLPYQSYFDLLYLTPSPGHF